MESGEKRRWRRKKRQHEKPMAVDSCQLVSLEKGPVDIERLAHKYMQKCTVESSTESESDVNTEVVSGSMASEGSIEHTSHTKLQVLDPYDGDYEDISGTSDGSLDSLADTSHRRKIMLGHLISGAPTPADQFLLESQGPFPDSADRAVSSAVTHEDEVDWQKTCEDLQQQMEPFWLSGSNSSKHGENLAVAPQPMLMEGDNRVYEDPDTHRKQGRPVLECAGEKLRKKLRVT